jgi:catechol 2,3-dioxygenase-like lactoylglutathione lyase family enzyme
MEANVDACAPRDVRVERGAACFLVSDVFATAEHYRDVLGFTFDMIFGDPPSFVILWRDDVPLMLKQAAGAIRQRSDVDLPDMLDAYFWVDDITVLEAELRQRGADIATPLTDRAIYDGRDLYVRDLDGRILCFGQLLGEES